MLAERSAGWHPRRPATAFPLEREPPDSEPPERERELGPPAGGRPPDASTASRPSGGRRGGEAKAGRDRTIASINVWRPRSAHCRNAGVVVHGSGWYVVHAGDTLWSIAQAHYGNGRAYRRLYRANWRTVFDPDCIYACQRIYIPRARSDWPAPFDEEREERVVGSRADEEQGTDGCSQCRSGRHVAD